MTTPGSRAQTSLVHLVIQNSVLKEGRGRRQGTDTVRARGRGPGRENEYEQMSVVGTGGAPQGAPGEPGTPKLGGQPQEREASPLTPP